MSTADLSPAAASYSLAIEELDAAEEYEIRDLITQNSDWLKAVDQRIGDYIHSPGPCARGIPVRERWFWGALERFRQALAEPTIWFDSVQNDSGDTFKVKVGPQLLDVRLDQISLARKWRIGIRGSKAILDRKIAVHVWTDAVDRLVSDLSGIKRLCADWASGRSQLEYVDFGSEKTGLRFELLIESVLNQEQRKARQAPLYEDVREWKDLVYSSGDNGIPVQVKLLARVKEFDRLADTSSAFRRSIVVAPVSLARFAESIAEGLDVPSVDWTAFLKEVGKVRSTQELSLRLWEIFCAAVDTPPKHPLDPCFSLSPSIKALIVAFVEFSANQLIPSR